MSASAYVCTWVWVCTCLQLTNCVHVAVCVPLQLTDFFQAQAPVNCVRMRRHMNSKQFKGSVFVEFASEADAEKVCVCVCRRGGWGVKGGQRCEASKDGMSLDAARQGQGCVKGMCTSGQPILACMCLCGLGVMRSSLWAHAARCCVL